MLYIRIIHGIQLTSTDGTIDKYKARPVAKGFTQEYSMDYNETFALVARLSSMRALLAIEACNQMSNGCQKCLP